jgi:excisionase family DNA binding protein
MPLDLITTPVAADMLGCSARTVQRMVDSGELTPVMRLSTGPNGAFLFKRRDVERLAKNRGTVTDSSVAS